MNYTLIKGQYRTVFTRLPEGGYLITQYQFLPGHLNWVPYSSKQVTNQEAINLMQRLAKQNYLMTKGG